MHDSVGITPDGEPYYDSYANIFPQQVHFDKEDNYELLQFSGLTDKSGVEIYESDIVKTSRKGCKTAEIVFERGSFRLKVKNIRNDELDYNLSIYKLEVVGNIFETPELSEGGKQ